MIVEGLNRIPGFTCAEPGAPSTSSPTSGLGGTSEQVDRVLLDEAGVAGLSGTAFGRPGEGYLRFSYANSVEAIREALDAIEAALPELEV